MAEKAPPKLTLELKKARRCPYATLENGRRKTAVGVKDAVD